MKFPRNARIFRGQLDAAPFAAVLFLLVIFLMLNGLVYTPGVKLQLPTADDLPGLDKPSVAVAIDASGRLYFENAPIKESDLKHRLREVVSHAAERPALVVQADKAVTEEIQLRLLLLARDAGFSEVWLAALPRPSAPSLRDSLP